VYKAITNNYLVVPFFGKPPSLKLILVLCGALIHLKKNFATFSLPAMTPKNGIIFNLVVICLLVLTCITIANSAGGKRDVRKILAGFIGLYVPKYH
jgi:hypothetical protein